MWGNYFLTALRHIQKNRLFSAINIFGLGLGLMCCILIMLFVRAESGYDTWLKDSDRLVRMHSGYYPSARPPFETVNSAGRLMEAIRDYAVAEVETGVRFVRNDMTIQHEGNAFSESLVMADGSFFDLFDLPFVQGSAAASYNKPFDMVITEEVADRYFGRSDVIGETLTICCVGPENEVRDVTITGVIKDLPSNTHLNIDMLVYMDPAVFANAPNILETWNSLNVMTYFKMRPGVTLEQLQERIDYWTNNESPYVEMFKNMGDQVPAGSKITDTLRNRVMSVPDLHLRAREHAGNLGDMTPMGDRNMLVTFMGVALLVLLIACINFMNLSTARASQRAREVALRKVLGASRAQVAIQFLGEAVGLVLVAMVVAVAGVEAVLPLYNDVLGTEIDMQIFSDPQLMAALVAIVVVVGGFAGMYPALYLSRFKPARILKANKSADAQGTTSLRTLLVVFQFAISITLVVSTAVVYGQTLFVTQMDVGYESNDKLILNVRAARGQLEGLKQELLRLPEIKTVAYSSEVPTQDNENNTAFLLLEQLEEGIANEYKVLNYHHFGYDFFETYGIKPVAGRVFSDQYGSDQIISAGEGETGKASIVLNETAVRQLGIATPEEAIGKTLRAEVFRAGMQEVQIIGVVPDFYFRSLRYGVRASGYMMDPNRFTMASMTFETDDVSALVEKVEDVWRKQVPLQPVTIDFLSEMMLAQYQDEQAQATLFAAFAGLAIIIACLGLYGLAAFTAERRTKEIGIRKVLGARVRDIVRLLVWQFSKPVVVANIIAWPVAFYFMSDWLTGFEYRIGNDYIVVVSVVAGVVALLIAWATVASRAFKVARSNPITALRYE
ncbi:ABC transporter permease [Kordiimonas sediminis]|uniref:ABC transporter permease n=1 Tax=Kordiimonas sediminis TaxID=1735581 RepID=A0A919E6W0_9PROT|nr:ABC transporter permease [Kordiimonas sediminis]GHF19972.1 ABC transporter permease [Kordiimonas sediminis]